LETVKVMHGSAKKILVIEDDTSSRNVFLECLKAEGFDVIAAENGWIGIQKAEEHLPDLVICDLVMPDMDGYTVLAHLRKDPLTAIIPFIFLTGSNSKAELRKAMELGADDYLTKPSTLDELLRAIAIRLEKQALLRHWYASNPHHSSHLPIPTPPKSESIFPAIPHLKKIFDYIETNYHKGITLSDVANAVGYSPAYLTNQVSKQTGHSINAWIVQRRMAAALPLLKNTNQTIEDIASKLGYKDVCYFSRQFRQHYGLSPAIWRKENQFVGNSHQGKLKFKTTRAQMVSRVPLTKVAVLSQVTGER
jgi:YesN/AraC family two-component response regulator